MYFNDLEPVAARWKEKYVPFFFFLIEAKKSCSYTDFLGVKEWSSVHCLWNLVMLWWTASVPQWLGMGKWQELHQGTSLPTSTQPWWMRRCGCNEERNTHGRRAEGSGLPAPSCPATLSRTWYSHTHTGPFLVSFQEQPTASSWTCSFLAALVWRK